MSRHSPRCLALISPRLVDPRAAYRFRSKDVANREREMMRGLSGREYKEAQQKLWHQRQWRRHASSSGGGEGGGWQRGC